MRLTDEAIHHIQRWEGFRPEAYPDPGSRDGTPWTIGYGQTRINGRPVRKGDTITEPEAAAWMLDRLKQVSATVERSVKVPLSDNQLGALVSFTYNVGAGAFQRSTLLRKLNKGDYDAVPAELTRWKYNDGRVMQGLVHRRAAEAGLWARGAHVAGVDVPAQPVSKPKPVLRPEVIGPAGAAASAGATALTQLGGLGEPVVWAIAIALVALTAVGVIWGVRRLREAT